MFCFKKILSIFTEERRSFCINQQPTTNNLQLTEGFTLIELLVVVALVGLLGTITTQVFILGMQSQGKTEVIKEVKQNGDFVLSVMESMIRNAIDLEVPEALCNNTNLNQLTILNPDGFTTTFDCSSTAQIASISGTLTAVIPTGIPLTGSRITVPNCVFRVVCPNPPVSPKYVYISFTVAQQGAISSPQNSSSLDYQTTVSLRNY